MAFYRIIVNSEVHGGETLSHNVYLEVVALMPTQLTIIYMYMVIYLNHCNNSEIVDAVPSELLLFNY